MARKRENGVQMLDWPSQSSDAKIWRSLPEEYARKREESMGGVKPFCRIMETGHCISAVF